MAIYYGFQSFPLAKWQNQSPCRRSLLWAISGERECLHRKTHMKQRGGEEGTLAYMTAGSNVEPRLNFESSGIHAALLGPQFHQEPTRRTNNTSRRNHLHYLTVWRPRKDTLPDQTFYLTSASAFLKSLCIINTLGPHRNAEKTGPPGATCSSECAVWASSVSTACEHFENAELWAPP